MNEMASARAAIAASYLRFGPSQAPVYRAHPAQPIGDRAGPDGDASTTPTKMQATMKIVAGISRDPGAIARA